MRYFQYLIPLICFAGPLQAQSQSYSLTVERQGDHLRVTAPQLHVLEGKPLERLQNGASVTYAFELTLTAEERNSSVTHLRERFILSFDLWEEKFSVVQAGPSGRAGSHLTAAMAEAWCLDNMPVPLPALPPDRTFMIKLECWAEQNGSDSSEGGLTLAGLIDVFSRKGRDTAPRWQAASGLLRLADLNEKVRNSAPNDSNYTKRKHLRVIHGIRGRF